MIAAAVALMCLGTLAFVVAGVYALLAPEAGGTAQPEVETSPPGVPDDGSLKCAFRVTRRVIALSSDDVIVMPPEGPGLGAKGEGPGCRLDEPTFVVDEGVSA